MRKLKLLFLIPTLGCLSHAQTTFSFPIDTIDITGNFGEIRQKHFHQGLDFSTKGKENIPVKSIDDGYVYRIKISSTGYGKALYIHHPSGLLSVYAHLNQFSEKIQSTLYRYLVQHQQNEIDTLLPPNAIPIKKNEIIGLSGNTGSSTGPHLHFELRNELTEIPLNPFFYFPIKDTTKPTIQKIIFYNLSDTIQPKPISPKNKKNSDTLILPPILGIAFNGYDQIYPTGNKNNICQVQIYLDNQKIYQHRFRYLTFDNTIYAEYFAEHIQKNIFQKCFTPHLYPPEFYDTLIHKGRIILTDTNYHNLLIRFCDENNNCTQIQKYIKTNQPPQYKKINTKNLWFCNTPIHIKNKYFELHIPEKALFNNIVAHITYNPAKKQLIVTGKPIPLKFPATLKIYHPLPYHQKNKILLTSKYTCYLPEHTSDNQLLFQIKELRTYNLYADTLPPRIHALQYNKKKKAIQIPAAQNTLSFKITDNTKIKEYKVYFNAQFCIAYYYALQNILLVQLPAEYIATDQNYIQLLITDLVGNTTQKTFPIHFLKN